MSASTHAPLLSPALKRALSFAGVAALLLLHAWLALSAMREKSTTVDEMPHLMAGHAMWATADYRLQPENGILPQRWEGLPAWLSDRTLPPPDHPGWKTPNVWSLGHAYFHQLGNDLEALLQAGRAMNLLWSIATGVLVFCWARRLFGSTGGWVALTFLAFCPTMLAHGPLATSDMCMTFFMLASVGAYWRHAYDFRAVTACVSALILGLAFVAKYSAVLLVFMLGALLILRLCDARPLAWRGRVLASHRARLSAVLVSALFHAVVVWAVIWLFHGGQSSPANDPSLPADYTRSWAVVLARLGWLAPLVSWARDWHVLPDAYLYGFAFVVDLSQMRGAFLNGETSLTGWVQFFPYAFLVKTPLALLLASLVALVVAAIRYRSEPRATLRRDFQRVAPLVVLFGVYWAFSLSSNLNIGHRHLLPVYPVVFIATGALGWATRALDRRWLLVVLLLLVGQIAASASIRPHYLAFFNTIGGGPENGYRQLVDSSLDWGQDLPGLARWLQAEGLDRGDGRVYLAYFGTGDPDYYGIRATPMAPLLRVPAGQPWYRLSGGVYCVSATLLSHAYGAVRGPWLAENEREFQDLRALEPALLDYARFPERRAAWEADVPAATWQRSWDRYEALRFARLCHLLRARKPDAQVGYSINIYRLSDEEVNAAVHQDLNAWRTVIEQTINARTRP